MAYDKLSGLEVLVLAMEVEAEGGGHLNLEVVDNHTGPSGLA